MPAFRMMIQRKQLLEKQAERRLGLAREHAHEDRTAKPESARRQRTSDQPGPEVAKRRALVRDNPDATADDLCAIFDRLDSPVQLPRKWVAAGIKSWVMAYKDPRYRTRIGTMISKDRRAS